MVRAIRAVTIEKGYDPRKFTLMPFGGAGGLHAADVARALKISRIIIPHAPGILCAEGLILSDLREDFVASHRCRVGSDADWGEARAIVKNLVDEAHQWLVVEGQNIADARLTLALDMRYVGQNYELSVEMTEAAGEVELPSMESVQQAFFAEYERAYGHCDVQAPIEIVNVRLRALAKLTRADRKATRPDGLVEAFDKPDIWPDIWRDIWFDERGAVTTPLYDRAKLPAGTVIAGPALVTQMDATTLVPPWGKIAIDDALNIIMEIEHD